MRQRGGHQGSRFVFKDIQINLQLTPRCKVLVQGASSHLEQDQDAAGVAPVSLVFSATIYSDFLGIVLNTPFTYAERAALHAANPQS